tara:strand:- start:243 stop:926 length:684 start_codon:yes stop_codon:yes gene_type:complete
MSEEKNIVDHNIEKYHKLVEKGIPISKEISEIRQDINGSINKCIKHCFDRKPTEFNLVKDLLFDNSIAEGVPKMQALLQKVKVIVEYCTFLGYESEFEQFSKELGLNLSLTVNTGQTLGSPGYESETKFRDEWAALFGKEPSSDKQEVMSDLMELAMDTKKKVTDLSDVINHNLGDELKDTGISKGTLKKGVSLKIRAEQKDDVDDKVNSITEDALLQSECIRTLFE